MGEKPECLLDWEEEERVRLYASGQGDVFGSPIPMVDAPFNSRRG